jgi:hypothetical protein
MVFTFGDSVLAAVFRPAGKTQYEVFLLHILSGPSGYLELHFVVFKIERHCGVRIRNPDAQCAT